VPISRFPIRLMVRRLATGYVVLADHPRSQTSNRAPKGPLFTQVPLEREQIIRILLDAGWHQQDVGDALAEADAYADHLL
jgi:hypothetical protein